MSCTDKGVPLLKSEGCAVCGEPGHPINGSINVGVLCHAHMRIAECGRIVLADPLGAQVLQWLSNTAEARG